MDLTLHTSQPPSYFNKDMLLDALIGAMVPIPGGMMIGGVIGAAIGSIVGRQRMEREKAEGKTVRPPSAWNKETAIGSLLGHYAGVVLGIMAATAAIASDMTVMPIMGAAVLGWAASTAVGAYLGARVGKDRMAHEYQEAQYQQIAMSKTLDLSKQPERMLEPDVQVEQGKGQDRKFQDQLDQEKLLATAQKNVDQQIRR